MNATIQIAEVLNVSPNQIKSVREMAWVYCVVVFGQRATFVSKKKVEAIKVEPVTRHSIAAQVAALINGKVWTGGDKVRVYIGKGFVEVGATDLNTRSLNNYMAYSAIRDAGLESYKTVSESDSQSVATVVSRNCLNCDITASILLGRGYCTDCFGEC